MISFGIKAAFHAHALAVTCLSIFRSRPASLAAGDKVYVELENKSRADATQHHDPDEAMWNDTAVQVQIESEI